MAYNEHLAERIRNHLRIYGNDIHEKKMFGGLSFLYHGKMTVGIINDELCVRYIENDHPNLLEREYVRPMDFTKKPMKEFIYVQEPAFENDEDLRQWISMGISHAKSKL